jgi:hypothetical protein
MKEEVCSSTTQRMLLAVVDDIAAHGHGGGAGLDVREANSGARVCPLISQIRMDDVEESGGGREAKFSR